MPDTYPPPLEAEDPQFVINPSQVLAAIKTGGSLLTFATLFFTALAGFARNLDLNGFILFMQRDDIAKGIASAATAAYLVWRLSAAKRKKLREVIMARHSPNRVAMLSTDLLEQVSPAPPSRARETTMPRTRLVDASVLCGGPTAPASTTGAATYDGGEPRPTVIAGVDVSRRDEVPEPATMIQAPLPVGVDDSPENRHRVEQMLRAPAPDVLDLVVPAPAPRSDAVPAVTIVNGVPRSPLSATVSAADGMAIILVEAHLHCAEMRGTPFPAGRISAPCSCNCFIYALADKSYIAVSQAIDPPVAALHFVGTITTPAPVLPADYFPSTRGPARPPTDPV